MKISIAAQVSVAAIALFFAGCSEASGAPDAAITAGEAMLTLAGPAQVVEATAADDLGQAAAVTRVDSWPEMNAKVFGFSGGDRALNGEQVYLALLGHPVDGWRAYGVADVESFEIMEAAPGRIVLALREQAMDGAGEVLSRTRLVRIEFSADFETTPDAVRVVTVP